MKPVIHHWKKAICLLFAGTMLFTGAPEGINATQEYWPEGPKIETPNAIVMEMNTGAVLYEKNSDQPRYPASITKIMTVMLALEHCEMDEVVTFSRDAIDETPRDSSHIARDYGEKMTMEECLYAIMLESANECAYAVAEHVGVKLGGDYGTFIDMMNDKVKELGGENTNFVNPSGLPDENHYVSARTMALIAQAAYKDENFRIITGTPKYQIPPTNKHKETTYLLNHHQMIYRFRDSNQIYEYCTGGKTGYTKAANATLVSYAEKDGLALVCVVLNTDGVSEWVDTRGLFDYCFQNFKAFKISEYETSASLSDKNLGVMNSYGSYVDVDKNAYIVLPTTANFTDATSEFTDVKGSSKVIASLAYTYAGRSVGSVNIVASGVKVEDSYFDKVPELDAGDPDEPSKNVVKLKPLDIALIVLGVVIAIVIIVLCKLLYDNYYVIIHNMEVRRQRKERFRPNNTKPRKWNKRNRMFR